MIAALLLVAAVTVGDSTTVPAARMPEIAPDTASFERHIRPTLLFIDSVASRPRPHAIQISDSYGWKFRTHRVGGFIMLPLFAAQYAMGSELLRQKEDIYFGRRKESVNQTLRTAHLATAIGVGTVFVANTVTGAMLLYENRNDPHNRGLKIAHTVLMLAADAGFMATGVRGRRALERTPDYARTHRQMALASIGVGSAGAAIMWIFNR